MTNHQQYHLNALCKDYDNKVQNLIIPSGLSNKDLDSYIKKHSSKVTTYPLSNLNKEKN